MNFFVFGDSITQGLWDEAGGWLTRATSYFTKEAIARNFDDPFYSFSNLGVIGDSTTKLLARFDQEVTARDDGDTCTIIFFIGTNDSAAAKNPQEEMTTDQFKTNYKKLIEKAQNHTNDIVLVGLTPCIQSRVDPIPWLPSHSYTADRIQKFDQIIASLAQDEGLTYVHLFEPLEQAQKSEELFPDGIHPNNKGHALIAETMLPVMQKIASAVD